MIWIYGVFNGILCGICFFIGRKYGLKISEDIYRIGNAALERAEAHEANAAKMLHDSKELNDESMRLIERQKAENRAFKEEIDKRIELLLRKGETNEL